VVVLAKHEQLMKAVNNLPGLSKSEIDEDAILLRAYGKGTDVLIDRESM
jgi:ethanolamine kinase